MGARRDEALGSAATGGLTGRHLLLRALTLPAPTLAVPPPTLTMTPSFLQVLEVAGLAALFALYVFAWQAGERLRALGRASRSTHAAVP